LSAFSLRLFGSSVVSFSHSPEWKRKAVGWPFRNGGDNTKRPEQDNLRTTRATSAGKEVDKEEKMRTIIRKMASAIYMHREECKRHAGRGQYACPEGDSEKFPRRKEKKTN